MCDNKNCKKVLFKSESPFPLFTAIMIGQIAYMDDYKILLVHDDLYCGFNEMIVELGLFEEVIRIDESDRSISKIEKSVNDILEKHSDIDDYFMCVFSDCYSLAFAYALKGKANLHIFPEGSSTVQLKNNLELIGREGEYVSKDAIRRSFFDKYPINLGLFDYTWMYDMNIYQGDFRAKKKHIDIKSLLLSEDIDSLLNKLNVLFKYEKIAYTNICVLDSFEPFTDQLDYESEKAILEDLLGGVTNKNIMVKPHPPNEAVPVVKYKYRNFNVKVLENADVPWELIFLNLINDGCREYILVSHQLEGTYIMTTVSLMPDDFKLHLISLEELEKNHVSRYLSYSQHIQRGYFFDLVKRKGIDTYIPQNIGDIQHIRETVFRERNSLENLIEIPSSDYFRKVGNLLCKSFLYDTDGSFWSVAYFSFVEDRIEMVFDVNKELSFKELVWIPSQEWIFTTILNLNITILDGEGKQQKIDVSNKNNTLISDGRVSLNFEYSGYCQDINIVTELSILKSFVKIYGIYRDKSWRSEFWDKWYDIRVNENVKISKESLKGEIWIYGNTRIAHAISEEFQKNHLKHRFVVSNDRPEICGDRVDTINAALNKYDMPTMIIITAMNDYDIIRFNMPERLRSVAIGLSDFTEMLLKNKDIASV